MSALLDVKNLTLQFRTDEGLITAVEDVSFSLNKDLKRRPQLSIYNEKVS